jgi:chromosome segregation ATPase
MVLGLWVLQVSAALAASPPDDKGTGKAEEAAAPLSAAGLKRIRENLGILDQNIKETKDNLTATSKNIKTLEQELADLTGIEKEHFDLRKKYLDYLAEANRQIAKNDQDGQKIDKQLKDLKSSKSDGDPRQQAIIAKANEEKNVRTKWRTDADQKVKRVNELMVGLQDNLGQIQARRNALKEQIQSWTDREKQFHRLLQEYQSKKNQLEKIAKK